MSKDKRYIVSFTEQELNVVMEAVGAYKRPLKAKADKCRRLYGIQPHGKHTLRSEHIRTAQHKMSAQRSSKTL